MPRRWIKKFAPHPQALLASQQAVVPCIPPVPRRLVLRVAVPASASVPVVQVGVPALVPVPEVLPGPVADSCLQAARRRVPSVRAVRRAAVDASSTRRPRKAQ